MYEYAATVTKVIDGDTIEVNIDLGFDINHTIQVKLYGVDTPEIINPSCPEEQALGVVAKTFVTKGIAGKRGIIRTCRNKNNHGQYFADFLFKEGDNIEYTSIVESIKLAGLEKLETWK